MPTSSVGKVTAQVVRGGSHVLACPSVCIPWDVLVVVLESFLQIVFHLGMCLDDTVEQSTRQIYKATWKCFPSNLMRFCYINRTHQDNLKKRAQWLIQAWNFIFEGFLFAKVTSSRRLQIFWEDVRGVSRQKTRSTEKVVWREPSMKFHACWLWFHVWMFVRIAMQWVKSKWQVFSFYNIPMCILIEHLVQHKVNFQETKHLWVVSRNLGLNWFLLNFPQLE